MQAIFEIIRTVIAPLTQILIALFGAYIVTLWIVLVIWTFRDIETRSRSVVTQVFATLLVVFFFLPGSLLYLILRPRETLDEAFQRALQEEYILQDLEELPLCPTCQRYVQTDFVLCPHCHSRLRDNCPHCSRLVDLRWSVCPYCAIGLHDAEDRELPIENDERAAVHLPEWVEPSLQRLRARVAQLRARTGRRAALVAPPSPAETTPPPAENVATSNGHNGHHEAIDTIGAPYRPQPQSSEPAPSATRARVDEPVAAERE